MGKNGKIDKVEKWTKLKIGQNRQNGEKMEKLTKLKNGPNCKKVI